MERRELSCDNCYFYLNAECHRNSPEPENSGHHGAAKADWPETSADDWCGDWKLKEEG